MNYSNGHKAQFSSLATVLRCELPVAMMRAACFEIRKRGKSGSNTALQIAPARRSTSLQLTINEVRTDSIRTPARPRRCQSRRRYACADSALPPLLCARHCVERPAH
jgi:hypothetical protein